ncbi:MAG TPA: ferredoxin-type protein NapF [Thiotrichales bacterium]|nr:ferredoxin-type protein NapF [Thiotrichales bacterium]
MPIDRRNAVDQAVQDTPSTPTSIDRRSFLRGDFRGRRIPLLPPWSVDPQRFLSLCTRCGDCLEACPEGILSMVGGGYPEVRFDRGECTFCGECAEVCRPGALRAEGEPWRLRAVVGAECLVHGGVACQVCGDHCDAGAIRFIHRAGRMPAPVLDRDACNGCGACYAPCPTRAIGFTEEETR